LTKNGRAEFEGRQAKGEDRQVADFTGASQGCKIESTQGGLETNAVDLRWFEVLWSGLSSPPGTGKLESQPQLCASSPANSIRAYWFRFLLNLH
jgi:hypothetical protein